jgi:hypothetical protein
MSVTGIREKVSAGGRAGASPPRRDRGDRRLGGPDASSSGIVRTSWTIRTARAINRRLDTQRLGDGRLRVWFDESGAPAQGSRASIVQDELADRSKAAFASSAVLMLCVSKNSLGSN